MSNKLLIVESPAKAKTIGKYLGGEFTVKSSVGHIRDLPKKGLSIKIAPEAGKEGSWTFVPTSSARPRRPRTKSISRPIRTAKGRPSRGTSARCSPT